MNRRQFLGGALATGLAALAPSLAVAADTPAPSTYRPRLSGVRRVIVDTDPGNDDALAILFALDAPSLQVEAITVCPGNLGPHYAQQVKNALFLVDLAGKAGKVAVHAGVGRPILNRPYPIATFIHGKFGLGRFEAPTVAQAVDPEHAVDAMHRIVSSAPGEITILALGGLTNVAMALLKFPEMAKQLKGIVFVGGKYTATGVSPSYNILVDPEAAHVVFTSGVTTTLVTGDAIRRDSILTDEDFAHIATFNTARSRFFIESNDLRRTFEKTNRGTTGSTNPDSLAVATVIDPAIATVFMPLFIEIELQGEMTRGLLVHGKNIYTLEPTPPPNVDICLEVSHEPFRQMVFATMNRV